MNAEAVLQNADSRMRKAVEALKHELGTIRTGRAHPGLVEHIIVEYYGNPTPLNQVAGISTPEARLLVIQPWDKQVLPNIEKAILKSDLGLNPLNDGNIIRLPIPQLTEERRNQLVKMVRKRVEEGKVAVRNVRREAL
jgi:ribosome recycling factor